MANTLWSVQRSEVYVRGRSAAIDDMRSALNRMTKDLRQTYAINGVPTSTHLDVQTYIKGVEARVVFDMSGGTLKRSVNGGGAVTIQDGLTNASIFTYSPDASAPDVVMITFAVVPSNRPDTTLTLNAEVTFRNR
jgi:hypothetical protein